MSHIVQFDEFSREAEEGAALYTREADSVDLWAKLVAPPAKPELFPRIIADLAWELLKVSGFDPGFVGMSALACVGAALDDAIKIQVKRSDPHWLESSRMWLALLGEPSVKKTPVIAAVTRPLKKIEEQLLTKFLSAYAQWKEDHERWAAGDKQDPEPEEPKESRLTSDDCTVEALRDILVDNPRGILNIRDELSGWFGAMGAYSEGGAAKDRAHWNQLYNGGPRNFDRVGRAEKKASKVIRVPNWSTSIIGAIQPAALLDQLKRLPHDGLLQRFIILYGQSTGDDDRPMNIEVIKRYDQLVRHIFEVEAVGVVKLSAEAEVVLRAMLADIRALTKVSEQDSPRLSSHLGKWEGLFARILLIYHAIDCAVHKVHPTDREVTAHSVEHCRKLFRQFLIPHMISFYQNLYDEAGNQGILDDARKIAEAILRWNCKHISNREITQGVKRWRYRSVRERTEVISLLIATSWLNGDSDATSWDVNPRVHTKFAERRQQVERAFVIFQDILRGKC